MWLWWLLVLVLLILLKGGREGTEEKKKESYTVKHPPELRSFRVWRQDLALYPVWHRTYYVAGKIQTSQCWGYMPDLKIPFYQKIVIRRDSLKTLNDFQKLLGDINWLCPYLKLTTREFYWVYIVARAGICVLQPTIFLKLCFYMECMHDSRSMWGQPRCRFLRRSIQMVMSCWTWVLRTELTFPWSL